MLANMACSLIEHKRINTTVAKAKALKQFIEPLITKSKAENNVSAEKGTHNRRVVFKNLRDKSAVSELFSTVAEKVGERPGGYTRIIKLGNRQGDNADMALIELVDFNELYNAGKPKKKKSTRRGGGKKSEAVATQTAEAPKGKASEGQKEAKAEEQEAPEVVKEEANTETAGTESAANQAEEAEGQAESKEEEKGAETGDSGEEETKENDKG